MEGYHFLKSLYTSPGDQFSIVEAEQTNNQNTVILTTWKCADTQEANKLFQYVLRRLRDKRFRRPCLTALLDGATESITGIQVSFVWLHQGEPLDTAIWQKDDFPLETVRGYRNKVTKRTNSHAQAKTKEAWAEDKQQAVVIKTWKFGLWSEANPLFEGLMLAAGNESEHVLPPLDISLSTSKAGLPKLTVVAAKTHTDLESDLRVRKELNQSYTEKELLNIAFQVSEGLLWAKAQVTLMQGVPHLNFKLSNVLLRANGSCQICDFRGYAELSVDRAERTTYGSPELLKRTAEAPLDCFASDVFSFGVCLLSLARLRTLVRTGIESEVELRSLVSREISKLHYSKSFQSLLEVMLIVNPVLRAELDSIRKESRPLRKDSDSAFTSDAMRSFASGLSEKENCRFQLAAWHMEKAWDSLLHRFPGSRDLLVVGLHFGELLCIRLSRFAEARAVFEKCLASSVNCEEAVSFRASLVAVFFYSDEYELGESAAIRFLESLSEVSAENLWTVAYYLIMSQWRLKKNSDAEATFAQLSQRHFSTDCPKALALKLHLRAWVEFDTKNYVEAERTRLTLEALCVAHFPNSMVAAENYRSWGYLCEEMNQLQESAHKHELAHRVFTAHFPTNINTARNLHKWAHVCSLIGRLEEAVQRNQQGYDICFEFFPTQIHTANSIADWADLCDVMGETEKSKQKYALAHLIYFTYHPRHENTAHNLFNWGLALKNRDEVARAEGKFVSCYRVYSTSGLDSGVKDSISTLRTLYQGD